MDACRSHAILLLVLGIMTAGATIILLRTYNFCTRLYTIPRDLPST
jgi:hypothetical protein